MKLYKRSSKKAGLSPGTLVHIGEKKTEEVNISMMDYDESQIQEKDAATVGECLPFKEKPTVTWVNVSGIHDVTVIEEFGKAFNIIPCFWKTSYTPTNGRNWRITMIICFLF